MKFAYYNDTNRNVGIHPATIIHGCEVDMEVIKHGEVREFTLPEGTYPWVKMWDYGDKHGLQILVSPRSLDNNSGVKHEPLYELSKEEAHNIIEHLKKINPHDKKEK
jgi:hypothetical protein